MAMLNNERVYHTDLSNTYGRDIVEMCSQQYDVWCVFHNSGSSHLVSK
jgi:hypothetical protein